MLNAGDFAFNEAVCCHVLCDGGCSIAKEREGNELLKAVDHGESMVVKVVVQWWAVLVIVAAAAVICVGSDSYRGNDNDSFSGASGW
ncbi:hypothetical protein J15TS10_25180 [Paenibacillus woosongensis]|uniref:Transmembrane protein n=1 Tax=Paenibacillus woosongensis TaxID=307580 RepID=A0ABQ4MS20_9BACL|nr:hypothetical protein J15TS10_25180 [Paenibacillus woosongensis]